MDRRNVLFGLAAAATPLPAAAAAPEVSIFASGPLAGNRVAQHFLPMPADIKIPDVKMMGADGPHRWSELVGKVRIVSLWAEWCLPCLLEAPDLADWRQRAGGAKFDILGVLTSSQKHYDVRDAQAALAKAGARALPTWVEPDGGNVLMFRLTRGVRGASIPCNLLIDAKGVIRGRSIGSSWADPAATAKLQQILYGKIPRPPPKEMEAITTAGSATIWTLPDADAFAHALADGVLDRT